MAGAKSKVLVTSLLSLTCLALAGCSNQGNHEKTKVSDKSPQTNDPTAAATTGNADSQQKDQKPQDKSTVDELADIPGLRNLELKTLAKTPDAMIICYVEQAPITVDAFKREYRSAIVSLQAMLGIDPNRVRELLIKAHDLNITLSDVEKGKLLATAKLPRSLEGRTYEQFLKEKKLTPAQFEEQVFQLGLAFKAGAKIIEAQLLSEMINRQLLINEAKRAGFYKSAFNQYLETKRTKQYKELIEKTDQTPEQVREELINQSMLEMVMDRIAKQAPISDDVLLKQYDANKKLFTHGPRAELAQIIVAAPTVDNPPMESVRTQLRRENPKMSDQELIDLEKVTRQQQQLQANELLKRALNNEDFKTLADNNSDDPQTRAQKNGGVIGYVDLVTTASPDLNKIIEAAKKLKSGQVAPNVIETSMGYHVLKVLKKEDAGTLPFAEVKGELKNLIANNNKQMAQIAWIKNKRRTADIKVSKEYEALGNR